MRAGGPSRFHCGKLVAVEQTAGYRCAEVTMPAQRRWALSSDPKANRKPEAFASPSAPAAASSSNSANVALASVASARTPAVLRRLVVLRASCSR